MRGDSVIEVQHPADRWYSFTGPTMGVLILVKYSPIWKCEYSRESKELFQDMWMVWWVR